MGKTAVCALERKCKATGGSRSTTRCRVDSKRNVNDSSRRRIVQRLGKKQRKLTDRQADERMVRRCTDDDRPRATHLSKNDSRSDSEGGGCGLRNYGTWLHRSLGTRVPRCPRIPDAVVYQPRPTPRASDGEKERVVEVVDKANKTVGRRPGRRAGTVPCG